MKHPPLSAHELTNANETQHITNINAADIDDFILTKGSAARWLQLFRIHDAVSA